MSYKTVTGSLFAIAIIFCALLSFSCKKKEESKVEYVQTKKYKTDLVDVHTNRMNQVNASTGGVMATQGQAEIGKVADPIPEGGRRRPEAVMHFINTGNYYGCANKEVLDNLVKFAATGKTKKYDALLNKGLEANEIIYFRPGEGVYIKETDTTTGELKVCKISETQTYWTTKEAIR